MAKTVKINAKAVIMKKIACFAFVAILTLLASCGADSGGAGGGNSFDGLYEGPYYTIAHPKGYAVEPVGTTVSIRRDADFAIQVASQPNPDVKLDNLQSIQGFVDIVKQNIESDKDNVFQMKQMVFSGKTGYYIESINQKQQKGGVMCAIPMDAGLVFAMCEKPVALNEDFDLAKNMIVSLTVTHDDFFSNPSAYQADDFKPGNYGPVIPGEYFEIKEVEGWKGRVDGPGRVVIEKINADKYISILAVTRSELEKQEYIDGVTKAAYEGNMNVVSGKMTYSGLEFEMLLIKFQDTLTESVNLVRQDGSMTYVIKVFGEMTPAAEKMLSSFAIK